MIMKKYLLLVFHYTFFICSLLFLPKDVSIYAAILLLSALTLQNVWYIVLPLVLCFYYPIEYTYILLAVFLYHALFYTFIKKNRFYALSVFFLSEATAFLTLYLLNGLNLEGIQTALLFLVIYGCINALFTYQVVEGKHLILPYNQKLIDLVMLLGYFFMSLLFSTEPTLMLFLFMQLYLIKDYKYNVLFECIYVLVLAVQNITLSTTLPAFAISFFPPALLLCISYENLLWIPILIYILAITFFNFKDKRVSIEHDYINSLFQDFTKYINNLASEYNKNQVLKEFKNNKLKELSTTYCEHCPKHTLCKTKIDKRYSFLAAAMQGTQQNIYDCPNYNKFFVNTNIELKTSSLEYSAIRALADELSFLYNQSLALKDDYEYFIGALTNYGYQVLDIDINLASTTLYFTLYLSNQRPIVESLLLRLAYKAFGERLEIKVMPEKQITVVHFFKAPELKITYAHTILAKNDNLMSGDNYYIKKDYNSSYIFALSDGMGSGYNAYLESADALKTISNLSSYHFSIKTILRLLEDLHDLKSDYDRYATLDFLYINTANRKMNLYKLGSTTTYVLHNNQLQAYENTALPLKLDEVNSAYEIDIYSGDFIFLLSDGISDFISKDEFYSIVQEGGLSAERMCENVIQYIKQKENNHLKDDLSLITIKAL